MFDLGTSIKNIIVQRECTYTCQQDDVGCSRCCFQTERDTNACGTANAIRTMIMNVVMMTMLPMHSFVQLNLIKIKADARVWIDGYFF